MAKRWYRRVWHVPKGFSYAIENSNWATRFAKRMGFLWIDKDCQITKDGVWVFGHWGLIAKNGFVLPPWFVKKYGRRPRIKDVTWEDLKQLQSKWFSYRGRRRYRFIRAQDGLVLIHRLGMGCMAEQKGDIRFANKSFWDSAGTMLTQIGMPNNKLVVSTLPTMAHAGLVMKAAHEAGRETMVIRAQDGVPLSWRPYMTWWRGKIKWLNR